MAALQSQDHHTLLRRRCCCRHLLQPGSVHFPPNSCKAQQAAQQAVQKNCGLAGASMRVLDGDQHAANDSEAQLKDQG